MTLNDQRRPVPERLDRPSFVLRRQRLSDNDFDYEAVMNSKELLRDWSHSSWPEDDFTLEQNAEDLAEHIGDFMDDLAYGFSIFVPSEDRLLGSLYIDPVAPFAREYRVDEAASLRLRNYDARIEYWLRCGVSEAFERDFVEQVSRWLRDDWWFKRVAFGSRQPMEERRELYRRLGLAEGVRLVSNDGTRVFYFHVRP